jgi:hypothetical protein
LRGPSGSSWPTCLTLLTLFAWHMPCPSLHTRLPPTFSGYHPCLFLLSFFPPSFFIFESLQLSSSPQICRGTPPLSTPPPCCCSILLVALKINSSTLHILFSLVLQPWLLLMLMVLCVFFSCSDLSICPTFVCC